MYKIELLIKKILKFILKFLGVSQMSKIYGVSKSDVSKLFKDLDKKNINYLVLRWYEDLPFVKEGEDIDILVSDDDFVKLKKLLKRGRVLDKSFIKIDLFPETSQKRFMSYYPPNLAKQLLVNKIQHKSGANIANPKDYFLSLTFHVLFHKGFKSGLKSEYEYIEESEPEHDYFTYLKKLMIDLNLDSNNITLENLESILANENWLPPLDVYFRRSKKNDWVYKRALDKIQSDWRENRGLAVFFIRDKGFNESIVNKLVSLLNEDQIQILSQYELTDEQALFISTRSRGGDWGKGPSAVSGGLPKFAIVCKDTNVSKKDSSVLEDIPYGVVEYDWVKEIKIKVRETYWKQVKRHERGNVIHSSDNGIEASHYMNLLKEMK